MNIKLPEVLAPAGDKNSFLAAMAAGADAIYCGLKIFSARMEAQNFSIEELSSLTKLAHSKKVKVYVAFNTLIKETEIEKCFKIVKKITQYVKCDALVVQDPAMIEIAKKAGFKNQLHLSTLANCSFKTGLQAVKEFGFSRVVVPREFTIDEIKTLAADIPSNLDLEVFIHGALCYAVSGRCYWSSWFGGKSGLRGRCVQPCRRVYQQDKKQKRFFSCKDFSIDVLTKILKDIPQIRTLKIEGRKKSPHYVYYTVKGYKLLLSEPSKKKEALAYLDYAFSRETTHYNFLSQRLQTPLDSESETGSGLFTGRIKDPFSPFFVTREELLVGDLLRIGYEDDSFHKVQRVSRAVPKKGKFYLNKSSKGKIKKGTPVFIIDRKEKHIEDMINNLEKELELISSPSVMPVESKSFFHRPGKKEFVRKTRKNIDIILAGSRSSQRFSGEPGIFVIPGQTSIQKSSKLLKRSWYWLPPLIFPDEETSYNDFIQKAVEKGARKFVLNAPWQISFFKNPDKLNLWAGPFCNVANSVTVNFLEKQGFKGVIVSPELDKENFLSLPINSKLPLGVVIYGNWPLAISRIVADDLKLYQSFKSPKGEEAWVAKKGNNYYIYPQWCLDIREKRKELSNAGYSLFAIVQENLPKTIKAKKRPGLWNWDLKLL